MRSVRRGLFIGKFQPFTNRHQSFIEYAAKDVDELIIGIGSAQTSYTLFEPFTAGERILMISRCMRDLGIRFYIILIEDIRQNSLWAAQVRSLVPPFDVVYTSNPLIRELFVSEGVKVVSPPDICTQESVSKSEWLNLVSTDDGWERFVPNVAADVMREVNAQRRIGALLNGV